MFRKLLLLSAFLLCTKLNCLANFDFNANCVRAYRCILSLRLPEARELINKEKAQHPQNGIALLLDNYYDFFYLLTQENKAEFDRLKQNRAARLDQLSNEDQNSPYYNFSIAQVHLQWALLQSRFGEYTSAGWAINKAYSLLKDNKKRFPAFMPNDIPLGVVNVLLGSLPNGTLKSILGFFGIKGDTQTGLAMLEKMAINIKHSPYDYHYDELVFYLTYIQTDVVNDAAAYTKMQNLVAGQDSGLLKTYIQGYIALRTGHSTEAISIFQNRDHSPAFEPYPYLDYLLAIAKMNRLDSDAHSFFNKFLQTNRGANFIKDTYLHLAWQCLLEGDTRRYNGFIQLVKTKGNTYHDKDRQALEEANDAPVNPALLRARLLCDGGFYTRALNALNGKTINDFALQRDKIEYYYRLGRIYDSMDHDDEALVYYQKAIAIGKTSTYHYAATSAIRMGMIYEQLKEYAKARAAYQMPSGFGTKQFKNSIDQKAKDGLKRIENK